MIYERTEWLDQPDAKRYPYIVRCGASGCFWTTCAKNEEQALVIDSMHICMPPIWKGGQVSSVPFAPRNAGRSALMVMWDELDICVNIIKKPDDTSDVEHYKARAGGIALCIATLASPHFRTEEEVSREALERWRMREGLIEQRPTPGYGGYNPPPPGSKTLTEAAHVASRPLPHTLTEQQIAGIKHAHKSVGFKPEDIAKAYSLSLPLVKQILEEPEPTSSEA